MAALKSLKILLVNIFIINVRCDTKGADVRIVNGSLAAIEDFPFQVALQEGKSSFCGGTLITPRHVLTAAHCVYQKTLTPGLLKPDEFVILAGTVDSENKNPAGVKRYIERLEYHVQYTGISSNHDIALITLASPLITGPNLNFIGIRNASKIVTTGLNCKVSGWGTLESDGAQPRYLMSLELPIYDYAQCKKSYGASLTDNMICAGFPEGLKDSCQGDSGGPLVCENMLTGVVSFGSGCATPNFPGVYTDVVKYTKWINTRIQDKYCDYNLHNTPQLIESDDVKVSIPYLATLMKLDDGKFLPFCEGGLISSRFVLTSAHCVVLLQNNGSFVKIPEANLKVNLGSDDVKTGSNYDVETIIGKDYSPTIRSNDIVLIKTVVEIVETEFIKPISLGSPSSGSCHLAGRASTTNKCKITQYSKKFEFEVASLNSCKLQSYLYTYDNKLCGSILNSTCQGDAAGILVCSGKLSGVYSSNYGCDDYGLYTDLTKYADWINATITAVCSRAGDCGGNGNERIKPFMTFLAFFIAVINVFYD